MQTNCVPRSIRAVLMVLALLLFGAVLAVAQTTPTASVSGIVSDPSGAVVPNAKVTVTDLNRGGPLVTQTNGAGVYLVKDLIPSDYKITVEASGFRNYEVGSFPLNASQAAVLNVTLQLGTASQTVEVKSQVQMVEPSNATLGGLVNNEQIVDLPLANRNVLNLMVLQPGVQPTIAVNNYTSSFFTTAITYSINGGLMSTSDFQLDGVSILNQSDITGVYGLSLLPSIEGIQEFKMETLDYSANYGRSGGGIMSMVSKSGTNSFHGSAFEFLQNDALDAANFFTNQANAKKSLVRYDQYGGSIGGPIKKNKIFAFYDYERNLNHSGGFAFLTLPTAAERQGDFSKTLNSNGQVIQVYNPFSIVADPTQPSGYARTAFPGNVVPSNLWDPVAVKATTYYPSPNLAGTAVPGGYEDLNNFGANAGAGTPQVQQNGRGDFNISSNKRAFFRYGYFTVTYGDPNYYGNDAGSGDGNMVVSVHNGVLGYTQTIGALTVVDLRVMYNRFQAYRPSQGLGFQLTTLGLPAAANTYQEAGAKAMFPGFTPENYASLGQPAGGSYYTSANADWVFQGTVSRVIGKQTLTMGAEQRNYTLGFFQTSPFLASFTDVMTQGPDARTVSNTAGNGFASFLMGTGATGYMSYTASPETGNHYFAEFVQDDYKLTKKFTLNLGFRLEEETGTKERYNRMTIMQLNVVNPISAQVKDALGRDVMGGYMFPGNGADGIGRDTIIPVEWKPNPRLGFAYSLNDKTVVRGAFGIFYGVPSTSATADYVGGAFSTSTPWLPTLDGITPNGAPQTILSNPFPSGFNYPPGPSAGLLTAVGTSLSGGYPESLKCLYNQQWNLSVQRTLTPNTMLQVAYVGMKGTHLEQYWTSLNTLQDPAALGGSQNVSVPNPFAGLIALGGVLNQPTVQQGYLDVQYPGWTGVSPYEPAYGNSEYEALQTSVQKRYANGTTFSAGYTWSKLLTDVTDGIWSDGPNENPGWGGTAGTLRNYYDRRAEHAVSTEDFPSRFTFSGLAALPFGRGKKFGAGWNSVTNQVLGGWQLNSILTLATGHPLEPEVANNTSYSFGGGQHPDVVPGVSQKAANKSINQWFNTAAFAEPQPYTFGTMARTMTSVRQDWTRNLDLSLFKTFSIKEKVNLQFRAEAFNFTNTVIFGTPGTVIGLSSFGIVSNQDNSPRVVQLALKLTF